MRDSPLIYIIGPFTGDVCLNVNRAAMVFEELLELGYTPICPHLTIIAGIVNPRPYDEWIELSLRVIDAIHKDLDGSFRLRGPSPGTDREESLLINLNVPIFEILEELYRTKPSKLLLEAQENK